MNTANGERIFSQSLDQLMSTLATMRETTTYLSAEQIGDVACDHQRELEAQMASAGFDPAAVASYGGRMFVAGLIAATCQFRLDLLPPAMKRAIEEHKVS